jgi:hypothetical protein
VRWDTDITSSLRRRKVIRYMRGQLTILDGRGLEAAACGCYTAVKETYASVLPQSAASPTTRGTRRNAGQ